MPKTYSLPEAARILGVDPDTLSAQARRGKLRARKVGRDWRVNDAEIERYRIESLGRYRPGPGSIGRIPQLPTVAQGSGAVEGSPVRSGSGGVGLVGSGGVRGGPVRSGAVGRRGGGGGFGAPSPAPKPGRKSERTG